MAGAINMGDGAPQLSGDDLAIVKRLEGDCDQVTVGDMWFAAGLIKQLYEALAEIASSARGGDPLARDDDGDTLAAIARHADRARAKARGERL